MASVGINMPNLPSGTIDEFIGFSTADGAPNSRRSTADQVAQRLIADGPLRDRLDDIATSAARPNWHAPVRVAATANMALADLVNGAAIDGVTLATSDRVLLPLQSNPAANGVYVVVASGTALRAPDADSATEIAGMAVFVRTGTVNGGKQFGCTAYGSITVGTTPLPFFEITDQTALNDNIATIDIQQTDLLRATREYSLPQTGFRGLISDEWDTVLRADRAGNVALGLDKNLNLRARILDAPGIPCLDYHYLLVNEHGQLVQAFDFDWQPLFGDQLEGVEAVQRAEGDTTRIYAIKDDIVAPITFGERDAFGPRLKGSNIAWIEDEGGALVQKLEDIVCATTLVPAVTDVVIDIFEGQSLARATGLAQPIQTPAPFAPGKAVMFNGGVAPGGTVDAALPFSPTTIQSLVDTYETDRETPSSQSAARLLASLPASMGVISINSARGGTGYQALKKGTQDYANSVAFVRRSAIMMGLSGRSIEAVYQSIVHGENDKSESLETFSGWMEEWHADFSADVAAYLDGAPVLFFLDQMSNWSVLSGQPTTSEVPLAQLQVCLDNPNTMFMVGPKYFLPTLLDKTHLPGSESALLGAYHGRTKHWVRSGLGWRPTYITSAVRTGNLVQLNFNTPDGDIEIDTTLVSDPGNYGVEFFQTGGAAVTINSVAKTDSRQLTVTLSGVPAGTEQKIGIARTSIAGTGGGPTTGPRSCIRDSSPDVDAFGRPMHNWACHQLINITI